MADGPDYKSIGLGVKDVIFGIATAAAGSSGGPAGAEGVAKASAGLDKLIAMAPLDDNKKKTPGDRMDHADKPKAAAAQASPAQPTQPPPAGPPPASPEEVASSNRPRPENGEPAWPPTGDARVTADHLSGLGWSREKIQKILGGPEQVSLAEVTREQPKGSKVASVDGTRLARVDAAPVQTVKAAVVPVAASEATAIVDGKKVADAAPVQITPASQVRIVDGRRVSKGGSGGSGIA